MRTVGKPSAGFDLDLKIDYRDTTSLRLDPKNTRHHTADQIAKLAASMTEFGMVVPVLRDRDDNVVAGHGRVMAARKAGITKIPTILIDHLSPAQLRAFAIADNKLHDLSDWDEVVLAEELKTLSAMDLDFSLEATGFEVAEIDTLILGAQAPMREGEDEVLPPIGPAVSRPGDLWQLGPHRILCGNALEAASYERLLDEKTADMAFSDAPYGVPIAGHVSTRRGAKQHREFLMGGGGSRRRSCGRSLPRRSSSCARRPRPAPSSTPRSTGGMRR